MPRMAFKVNANDIAIENLTITNRTPVGGSQAEALMIESAMTRFICNNANIASYQDTHLGEPEQFGGLFLQLAWFEANSTTSGVVAGCSSPTAKP